MTPEFAKKVVLFLYQRINFAFDREDSYQIQTKSIP
jgi:hypothetical protein